MSNQDEVISRIKQKYDHMSKSHKAIANFIFAHYEQAVFMTAAKIGEELGISESTVVRFAGSVDYAGFPEFQAALAQWVKGKLTSVQKMDVKYGNRSQSEILNAVLNADMGNLQRTLNELDCAAFDMAVHSILEAENIYILGVRSCEPLADFLHFYLNMIRGNVVNLKTTSVTEIFEQMIRISEKDAFIGISFPRYSMRTLKATEFARDRNAKVISITDSARSPMSLYSSCNLIAKSDMVSIVDSLVAPLSVINALVVALCMKCPDEVKNSLLTLEKVWNDYQVYLNDEIDFIGEEPVLDYSLNKKDEEDE